MKMMLSYQMSSAMTTTFSVVIDGNLENVFNV